MRWVVQLVFSAFFERNFRRAPAGVRKLWTAFYDPPVRLAASWIAGLLFVTVLYWHLAASARNGRQTLSGLSWCVDSFIACGRAIDHLLMAFGWHIVVAVISVALSCIFVMARGRRRRSMVGATLASALGVASILGMAEGNIGPAVGLAFAAAVLLLACGPVRVQERETALGWPLLIPLAIGGVLRFWSLAEYPRGFAQHAVEHLRGSVVFYEGFVQILRSFDLSQAGTLWSLFGEQWGPMSMVDGVGFLFFGVGWVQARLTQAVLGCLAICAAYALGAVLDGRRLGFLFSFLLAVSPWHLAFSRYGDAEHVLPTLQALLAIFFVFRATRFGGTRDYLLAGITVAMSWYVYATNQIIPIVAAGYLSYKLIASRGFLKRDGIKLIYMVAVFVVMSIPHVGARGDGGGLWLLRTPPGEFNPRAVTDFNTTHEVGQQLYRQVDESWFYREGGGLGPTVQSLLIVGTVLCVAGLFVGRRRDTSVLLLLWLVLSFLPGILGQTVHFRRLLLTLVVALLLSAIAIVRALRLFEEGGIASRTSRASLIGLCVIGAATSSFVYFEEVRIEECNLHVHHTEIADFVSKHIGEAYLYAYAPSDDDQWTLETYISLFAYENLREQRRQGKDEGDLVAVVDLSSLNAILTDSLSVDGKTKLIASREEAGHLENSSSLRYRMARANRHPREHGEMIIWEWGRGSGLGRSRQTEAVVRSSGSPAGGG